MVADDASGTRQIRLDRTHERCTVPLDLWKQRARAGGSPDLVLDAAPPSGVLPDLVKIAGDPKHVLTLTDFDAAKELGLRDSLGENGTLRFDILGEFAQLAAEGKFEVPVARVFALEDWRSALELGQGNNARGKIVLLLNGESA